MLGRFKYDVTFKSTGKRLHGDIDFKTGLSGITGANEKGKSTILELVRFALFGTTALRSTVAGYEKLSVELTFTVNTVEYNVSRTKSNAILKMGGKALASGTSVVNDKIERIFGYGLNVFDIAHFCGQGEVEALTAMKPLDRKKMIDRVIGMDNLDTAAAAVAAEATQLRAEIRGMELGLGSPPQMPVPPIHTTDVIKVMLGRLKPQAEAVRQINAWLQAHENMQHPVDPKHPMLPSAEDIRRGEADRDAVIARSQALCQRLAGVPEVLYSEAELVQIEADIAEWEFVRLNGARPSWTVAQIDELLEQWKRWNKWSDAKAKVDLLTEHKLQCPECGHAWATDAIALFAAEEEMAKWEGVEEPSQNERDLNRIRFGAVAWANRAVAPAPSGVRPTVSVAEVAAQRQALAMQPERAELARLVIPPSKAVELRERESYDRAVAEYDIKQEAWMVYVLERDKKRASLEELKGVEEAYEEWSARLPAALEFDALHNAYVAQKDRYEIAAIALTQHKEQLEQLIAAADAVKTLRSKIKRYLVPSLNVAASNLISRMTGGQRQDISIDENFETILVDGQPVETLSGSAKAVANLSIRLGLGQVLTNRVFSVFLGDEIDASMDADRADYTAECLRGLNSVIEQIILVSHKDLAVQHQIKIG